MKLIENTFLPFAFFEIHIDKKPLKADYYSRQFASNNT
jgi:hypothetical protein